MGPAESAASLASATSSDYPVLLVTGSPERTYALVAGVEVVRLEGDDVLLRSDTLGLRLEGPSARLFAERLAPKLVTPRSVADLQAAMPETDAESLQLFLEGLVAAGAIRHGSKPGTPSDATILALLAQLGRTLDLDPLRRLRVGIVGLEAHGAHLAANLVSLRVGALALVDPFPLREGHLPLMPSVPGLALGRSRAATLVARLREGATGTRIEDRGALGRAEIEALAGECDVLVSCIDRGFSAASLWVNRAALARRIPALYGQLAGHIALVGPFVVPGETACFLCWRMRAIACELDYEAGMRYEEWLDARRQSVQDERAVLPGLPAYVGSLLTTEIVKLALGLAPPALTGTVHEFNGLTFDSKAHAILAVPDCPACGSPTTPPLPASRVDLETDGPRGDVLGSAPTLVSSRSGLIRDLELLPKDASEPELPYVYRAQLANRQFHDTEDARYWSCSGKGLTDDAARRSALGEAVERYGGFAWSAATLRYGRRDEIDSDTLDPRALVLFADEQYSAALPYSRYDDATAMSWMPARDLVSGRVVQVPALAALMDYHPRSDAEHLFPVTSNGLGGGATLADAALAATQEVIERDAFLLTWLNQLPAQRVDPNTHPEAELVGICHAYRRRGIAVELFALARDHPCHVFLALAVAEDDRELPAVVTGLGADIDPAVAARRAILEIGQVRPALRANLRRASTQTRLSELLANPSAVHDLEDHDLLYASPHMRSAFGFLRAAPMTNFNWETQARTTGDKLDLLIDAFARAGRQLLYCDLTPAELQRLHLYSVRAILPEFQPIYFGEQERRLGGRRLFDFPAHLGFGAVSRTIASLNPNPHPLA